MLISCSCARYVKYLSHQLSNLFLQVVIKCVWTDLTIIAEYLKLQHLGDQQPMS